MWKYKLLTYVDEFLNWNDKIFAQYLSSIKDIFRQKENHYINITKILTI